MKNFCTFLFTIIMVVPTFATDLTGSSASCDSGVLGIESGNIALRAEYEPESIELRWYDENDNLITVNSASTSCTYGGSITLPATPTKTGYKFTGWKVINILTTLDYSIDTTWDATHTRWKPINGSSGSTMETVFGTENSSDLSNGEWADTFSYGTVIGNAMCSTTSDTYATTGTPANDGGQNCWCMATGYQPSDSDVVYSPNSPLSWVSYNTHVSASNCAYYCAVNCAYDVQRNSDVRRALFGQSN